MMSTVCFPHIVALDDDQVGYLAYQAHRHKPRKPSMYVSSRVQTSLNRKPRW
jgi:hypothetical protein